MKKFLLFVILLFPGIVRSGTPQKEQSVLANGTWVRIAVTHTGIHAITYDDLVRMNFQPDQINPDNIRLFGNGGGMLSETTSDPRVDDLRENSIEIRGGSDGSFDPGDLILFYGEGPDKWYLNETTKQFNHVKNFYSDSAYYFITTDSGPGLRVATRSSSTLPADMYAYRFDDYAFYELDSISLIRSGKLWFGERFDKETTSRTFHFSFPNIDTLSALILRTYVAAKCSSISYFKIWVNGTKVDSAKVDATPPDSYSDFGKAKLKSSLVIYPDPEIYVTLEYSLPVDNGLGWLNYLEVNASRNLIFTGSQLPFRNVNAYIPGRINEYVMSGADENIVIWDITDPGDIRNQEYNLTAGTLRFRLPTDTLKELLAFNGTYFYPVHYSGPVKNQNLHALQPKTLIIVTHPDFEAQALRIADFHLEQNGIGSVVVRTDQIFQEFSSGQQDLTAIRDFVRMLYNRDSGDSRPRYLLLFGDGSYDPKDRAPGNNNLVPTFQSAESLKYMSSYVSDDYFGLLEDGEGLDCAGDLDIGIGRFPVSTAEEAEIMVNKIIGYPPLSDTVSGDWRNSVTFVADDENDNLHMIQAEELAQIVAEKYPEFNVEKIYLDAYNMEQVPSGARFPQARKEISEKVEEGTLIMNYTGHGSEAGWSWEQVLTIPDIEKWHNSPRLPVFVTATCEFSRFDNPERYTAGEMVILHPDGGAIALYSTTRLALSTANFRLDTSFFRHLKDKVDGNYLRMGDLIRISKNNNGNNPTIRNFVLLGDPVQHIAFPEYGIRTISINNEAVNQADTALGLSAVTVTGQVEDAWGQKITGFNGKVSTRVYDKPYWYKTLGNTNDSYPQWFRSQNGLLFKGDNPVRDGEFSISFVVPRGIALQFGNGKISYYAKSGDTDAAGYTDKIIIGGQDPNIEPLNAGPEISLFMDNRGFVSGGSTGSDPLLIADLADTNGINYIGLGIGHDIIATLDGDNTHPIDLNNYYIPELGNPGRGTLQYPLEDMAFGKHTLSLKAWDMYDNSAAKEIEFWTVSTPHLTVEYVENRPNPLITHTWFMFQPVQNTGGLDVIIQIYDPMGRPVKTITGYFAEPYTVSPAIYWDGSGDTGRKLSSGIYPYRVTFNGKDGTTTHTSGKLVILR